MEPLLDASFFHRRLAEVIAWCSWRLARSIEEHGERVWRSGFHFNRDEPEVLVPADLPGCLRTPELQPHFDPHPNNWGLPQSEKQRSVIVEALAFKRADLLRARGIVVEASSGDLAGGLLLAYAPGETLSDGASSTCSEGFIDGPFSADDVPPWDTWVLFVPSPSARLSFLLAWVPPSLIGLVADAVYANGSGCLFWLDDPDNAPRDADAEIMAHFDALTSG